MKRKALGAGVGVVVVVAIVGALVLATRPAGERVATAQDVDRRLTTAATAPRGDEDPNGEDADEDAESTTTTASPTTSEPPTTSTTTSAPRRTGEMGPRPAGPGGPAPAPAPGPPPPPPAPPPPPPPPAGAPTSPDAIVGSPIATLGQARALAAANGAPGWFVANADLYWSLAPAHGGVRADVAYAQSILETGWGRFGGVINATFHNPCGLKTTAGGPDSDPNAHQRFPDWRTGVIACLDHLALYAGAPGYPRAGSPDPRHFPFLHGTATTITALGGRWAPSADYGANIRSLVDRMLGHAG